MVSTKYYLHQYTVTKIRFLNKIEDLRKLFGKELKIQGRPISGGSVIDGTKKNETFKNTFIVYDQVKNITKGIYEKETLRKSKLEKKQKRIK